MNTAYSQKSVIGIDLGTSNCCAAISLPTKTEVIINELGSRTTPSFVTFDKSKDGVIVGMASKMKMDQHPERTVQSVKRLIGKRFSDPKVQSDAEYLAYRLVEDVRDKIKIHIKDEKNEFNFRPEEISSILLKKMIKISNTFVGREITQAVIAVPAYFTDAQRKATKTAGEAAGIEVLHLIKEPLAAAIAYHEKIESKEEKKVLIFDLGGGTFDISIIELLLIIL